MVLRQGDLCLKHRNTLKLLKYFLLLKYLAHMLEIWYVALPKVLTKLI